MAQFSGGCLCGKVRYSADAEPAFVGVCHCKDCQKFTGSAFATVVALPKATLTISGPLTTYTKTGDTGKRAERSFCSVCGSSMVDEAEVMPGIVMIGTGTLDDASGIQPGAQIFCASAQPWVQLGGEMHRFEKMPG
jgi:hypothetical protein